MSGYLHRRLARPISVTGAIIAALLLAGCASSSVPSAALQPSATASSSVAASQPPSSAPSVGASPSGPAAGQTDTEWGRIWDTLPPSFPRYPGAKPSEPTGPASATLVVPSDVQTATSWMKAAMDAGEWVTIIGGPLEDGSMALQSTGVGEGCQVITKIAKVGGVTIMTIQYAAACPFQ
jgi:hypothetical protein